MLAPSDNYFTYIFNKCLANEGSCLVDLPMLETPGTPFVSLEHVNLNMGIHHFDLFADFYLKVLGLASDTRAPAVLSRTNDARSKLGTELSHGLIWANIGLQQFHLPFENPPQMIRGTIYLSYSSENFFALVGRLERDGRFQFAVNDDSNAVAVFCPIGNRFIISSEIGVDSWYGPAPVIDPKSSGGVQLPGGASDGLGMYCCTLFNQVILNSESTLYTKGISAIEFDVPLHTAELIARFYRQYFRATVEVSSDSREFKFCDIKIGFRQFLRFRETLKSLKPYDGHHIALYLNDFVAIYHRLKKDGLIYDNPRFPQFSYGTVQEVLYHNEYRILNIIDVNSGETIFELEHELRSLSHPAFSCKEWLS